MVREDRDLLFGAFVSFMLAGTIVVTLVAVHFQDMQEKERIEEEKKAALDCISLLENYCKNRREKGQITSFECPLIYKNFALYGTYECRGKLSKAYLSFNDFTFSYEKEKGSYLFVGERP